MSTTVGALTELGAVNRALKASGIGPVNSLDDDDITSDPAHARAALTDAVRELCEQGFSWNTEYEVAFEPDVDSHIDLPGNVAAWVPSRHRNGLLSGCDQYVVRNGRVYDRENQTDEISQTIYADVKWYFDFDDLPPHFKQYCAIKAGRQYLQQFWGMTEAIGFTERDEMISHSRMVQDSIMRDNPGFHDDTIAHTIQFRYR